MCAGGQFIGNEFFFHNKRQKRQQTEDDRIYGIFADGDSSDEDRRGRRRERADYSQPVSFVSKGQVVNKPEEDADQKKTQGDAMEEENGDDDARPSFATMQPLASTSGAGLGSAGRGSAGAGLGSSGAGLGAGRGFTSAGQQDEEDDDEEAVLPTAFGQRWVGGATRAHMHQHQFL